MFSRKRSIRMVSASVSVTVLVVGMLALGVTACSKPPEVARERLDLVVTTGLVELDGQPFTGAAVSFHPDGTMASRTAYLAGKRHGLHEQWFDDGRRSFSSEYVMNRRHGTTVSWWRNGHRRSESHWEDGVAHGTQTQWYVSGALFKRQQLHRGTERGLQQSWRENGKLFNNYEARNGRTYGLRRSKLCFTLQDEEISIGR